MMPKTNNLLMVSDKSLFFFFFMKIKFRHTKLNINKTNPNECSILDNQYCILVRRQSTKGKGKRKLDDVTNQGEKIAKKKGTCKDQQPAGRKTGRSKCGRFQNVLLWYFNRPYPIGTRRQFGQAIYKGAD